ncbi:DAK2 domain-containing protein [Corynebacterium timonense]|uniref:DhaL domain-containing protein n=1 Tax=Corynebacterium timonense TaxID=441500 RepID=A0A1H1PQH5_9CORY|nr:DAK2 domain-containing protein [Corynebacterium timonense]SDS13384.1 hypothetical protein SAMN04488539_1076 [Corynebacterium timonense]
MVTAAAPTVFDGARLLSWARRSATELERRRVEINELNVFPVRDSDTGSNMAHTMKAAVAEAESRGAGASVREVAEALAVGSVRGARGNSGIVLSQFIRAIAQSVSEGPLSAGDVATALNSAVQFVDRAITDPVEGTVVTVLRAAAGAASDVAEGAPLEEVADAALSAARAALAKTPSQLEVLREAGVVDAGGAGLVILLEEFVGEVAGRDAASAEEPEDHEPHSQPAELEVMFLFSGPLDELEAALTHMGTSLVVARVHDTHGKVHIHSADAGRVIETAYAMGEVGDLRLEVLPPTPVTENPERLIVALTPAGSLAELYTEAGAVTVEPGDDVVSEVLSVVRRSPATEVILLPNGQLDSRQIGGIEKAARAFEQTVTVLPTVRLVSGIAALTVHDPDQPLSTMAFTMSEAAGEMRTAAIQRGEEGLVVVTHGESTPASDDPCEAVAAACRRLLEHGGEQVVLLYCPEECGEFDTTPLAEELGVDVLAYPADGLGSIAELGVE